jgi:hypothetical protein
VMHTRGWLSRVGMRSKLGAMHTHVRMWSQWYALMLQVHLHRAIVEQVRVMRKSLRSRSSVGSRASSDWGEMHSPPKTYSWAAGADGALTPQGETALQQSTQI